MDRISLKPAGRRLTWSNFLFMGKTRSLDSSELKLLFELFAQRVFQAAYFILRDRVLAEDVMQETFLVAMEKLGDLRDPAKIEIWLTRIAVNKALNERRKRTTRVLFKNIPTIVGNPTEEIFLAEEEKGELHKAIEVLPANCQVIVYLKYFRDMTTKQIAYGLNIPEGTVKSRLRKAYDLIERKFTKVRTLGEVT
jgi:RNA polymerase sigma-70 factor (ECF subfamily)